jgi:DNA polymerase
MGSWLYPRVTKLTAPEEGAPQREGSPERSARRDSRQTGGLFEAFNPLNKISTLAQLREEIGDCHRCKLWRGRTHLVYGVGNPKADLVFVGEGPGAEEDRLGEPFVGRAGQLLTDMITKGMGMSRGDVYIANVIKCRPPENRYPELDEIACCEPFLHRQLEIIRPKVIVALGRCAVQSLIDLRAPMGKLRGQWHEFRGMKVMPTFHPAYLLRNPAEKKAVWEDLKRVMEELGRKASG